MLSEPWTLMGLRIPHSVAVRVLSGARAMLLPTDLKIDEPDQQVFLLDGERIVGYAVIGRGLPLDVHGEVSEFSRLHGMTDAEIAELWPDASILFLYPIKSIEIFDPPVEFDPIPSPEPLVGPITIPAPVRKSIDGVGKIRFVGTKGMIDDPRRKYASILITEEGFTLRIDKGDEDDIRYDALVLTHVHPDHAGGLDPHEPVFGSPAVKAALGSRVHEIKWRIPVPIGPFKVTVYPVLHSIKAPASAIRIEGKSGTIVYAPDILSWYSSGDRHDCLDAADIYIGDGSHVAGIVRRADGEPIGHASWRTQVQWAVDSGIPKVIFTHLGKDTIRLIDHGEIEEVLASLSRTFGVQISVASDGDELVFVQKLDLERFQETGIDYDLQHPAERWRELLADLRYLANAGYVRLKAGKPWGKWTIDDLARYFGKIVDTLRSLHFPLIPPEKGDPRYDTPYWELYRLAERSGYIKTKPPDKSELAEWEKRRAEVIKSDLYALHQSLPETILITQDWASLSGSMVYGQHVPEDVDIILKSGAPSGALLKIQRAIQEQIKLPVQFSVDPAGPVWDFMPLYDLVAIKTPFSIQRVREDQGTRMMLYKALQTDPENFRPGVPIKHYDVAGEFYIPHELRLAWDKWGRRQVERGEKIFVNPKYDGIRFIVSWDGRKLSVFTEKGEDRSKIFPDLVRIAKKIGTSFVFDTEFVEFDERFENQLSRTVMTWMAVGNAPKSGAHIKIYVHDVIYANGKNIALLPYSERWEIAKALVPKPIRAGNLVLELAEVAIVDNFEDFAKAVNEFRTPKPGRSTEGAMAKLASFVYDPDQARTQIIKMKNRIEIDALIIGYRELPKPKPPNTIISKEEAMRLLKEGSGTYIFRIALLDEKTGKFVPIEAKKKLTERDLEITWNEAEQRWEGTDDPRLWTMFFGLDHRGVGEYAYGNTFAVSSDMKPQPGAILTISPMEITTWSDEGLHISFQHPIPVGLKAPGHPVGTVQAAFAAHQKVLPAEPFAVLLDIDHEAFK